MWKKDEEQATTTGPATPTRQTVSPSTATSARRAVIGPSISIQGDITGSEDLLIEGEVDGSVSLADHAVGVGSEGRVNADIVGRVITVEGHVEGNLNAQEQIVLRGTAKVRGDIKAPRVVLEDGANFRGLVDMGTPEARSGKGASEGKKAEVASSDEVAEEGDSKANGATKAGAASTSSAGSKKNGGSSKDAAAPTSSSAAK